MCTQRGAAIQAADDDIDGALRAVMVGVPKILWPVGPNRSCEKEGEHSNGGGFHGGSLQ
jgi:hypothetical protein